MKPMERFNRLRKTVMDAIARELAIDSHCKSYEGAFEWRACYPDYFEDADAESGACYFVLTLHCYVLGSARHYDWHGKTMDEVLDKAEKEIASWIGDVEFEKS